MKKLLFICCAVGFLYPSLAKPGMLPQTSQENEIAVTNTLDQGEGSLRQAIEQANGMSGATVIFFQIPTTDSGYQPMDGIFIINAQSPMPTIQVDSLSIEGYTQNSVLGVGEEVGPVIEIDGSATGEFQNCFTIVASDVHINGLGIVGFGGAGISLYQSQRCVIWGCNIGITSTGLGKGNYYGIHLYGGSSQNAIVGSFGIPNIISANSQLGIFIQDSSKENAVEGNIIGLDLDFGGNVGNGFAGIGIQGGSDLNIIVGNIIGNNGKGIQVSTSKFNEILFNEIGTDTSFNMNFGNLEDGILLTFDAHTNFIVENTIGHNVRNGVRVEGSITVNNIISLNSISMNGEEGIKNYRGGNRELAPPVIQKLEGTTLSGTTKPLTIVEVYADKSDEGRYYLASSFGDLQGNFSLELDAFPQATYSLTAIALDSAGNTSEFSQPYSVTTSTDIVLPVNPVLNVYPNPFEDVVWINVLTVSRADILLDIVGSDGKIVCRLAEGGFERENHPLIWDGRDSRGQSVSPGIYFVRLIVNGIPHWKKLMRH